MELPDAHSFDMVMVVVDSITKQPHFMATNTTVSAEGATRLYYQDVWKLHGLPLQWLHDRGSMFIMGFMRELNRLLGIKTTASTAYHPQTDGKTECVNQELKTYIRMFCNHHQNDWNELIPSAEFTAANHVHSSTQVTPFVADTGRNPHMGFKPLVDIADEDAAAFQDRMQTSLEEAREALSKAQAEYALYYNCRCNPIPTFKPGNWVLLDASDIHPDRPRKKLDSLHLGPSRVITAVGKAAYKLELPPSLKCPHPVFPVVKLLQLLPDPFPSHCQPPSPDPIIVDNAEHFELDKILDSRVRYHRVEYLVKWKGYNDSHNQWIPWYNLDARRAVCKFHKQFPNKPSADAPTSKLLQCLAHPEPRMRLANPAAEGGPHLDGG